MFYHISRTPRLSGIVLSAVLLALGCGPDDEMRQRSAALDPPGGDELAAQDVTRTVGIVLIDYDDVKASSAMTLANAQARLDAARSYYLTVSEGHLTLQTSSFGGSLPHVYLVNVSGNRPPSAAIANQGYIADTLRPALAEQWGPAAAALQIIGWFSPGEFGGASGEAFGETCFADASAHCDATIFNTEHSDRVWRHEFGHNLGLYHSSSLYGGSFAEYGNLSCLMGSDWSGASLTPLQLEKLKRYQFSPQQHQVLSHDASGLETLNSEQHHNVTISPTAAVGLSGNSPPILVSVNLPYYIVWHEGQSRPTSIAYRRFALANRKPVGIDQNLDPSLTQGFELYYPRHGQERDPRPIVYNNVGPYTHPLHGGADCIANDGTQHDCVLDCTISGVQTGQLSDQSVVLDITTSCHAILDFGSSGG
ncbi:MAG: hypothetical protein H6707_12395 [Deltaproteobacteria bacterium]|nr:hypothetical protein [Deltaproteobacteria bacterium]